MTTNEIPHDFQDLYNDAIEPSVVSLVEKVTSEVQPLNMEDWSPDTCYGLARCPFENHVYSTFVINDEEFTSYGATTIRDYYLMPAIDAMVRSISDFDMIQVRELPVGPNLGALQNVHGPDDFPVRVTINYDILRQGHIFTIDALFRHVGRVHYPIIGGPMHEFLMPFAATPEDGHEFEYLFDQHTRHNFTLRYDDDLEPVHWPGLDMDLVRRQKATKLKFRFVMPYVYYLGEELS